MIPYARHVVTEEDVEAVEQVLRSDRLTQGEVVPRFEAALAEYVGAKHAVAFSSGTAALHAAYWTAGVRTGDHVVVPALTFVATANAALMCGAKPLFADVDPNFLTIRSAAFPARAIVSVDYAGHPAHYDGLKPVVKGRGAVLIADACHAFGAEYKGRKVGSLADMTCFSFHPAKHITTGEGGMVTTDGDEYAEGLRLFREHGREDGRMVAFGHNYRMPDVNASLGLSQLKRIEQNLGRRRRIAEYYAAELADVVRVPPEADEARHAWHLYAARVHNRDSLRNRLREAGIGTQVHYDPIVPLQPYYREHFGYTPGEWPVAEQAAKELVSLPMHHGLTDGDVERVVEEVRRAMK